MQRSITKVINCIYICYPTYEKPYALRISKPMQCSHSSPSPQIIYICSVLYKKGHHLHVGSPKELEKEVLVNLDL